MNVVSPADTIVLRLGSSSEAAPVDAEILAMVTRADADVAAGRFITVEGPADSDAVHEATMARLRAHLMANHSER